MANALIKVLTDFNILDKLIAITTDNASNNNTMIEEVSAQMRQRGFQFDSTNNHVRCFAHIVNLACKVAFDEIKTVTACDYAPDNDDDEEETDTANDSSLIVKLRKGIKAIRKSVIRRETFKRLCVSENVKHNELLLDVATRWNSTYYMIKRVLKIKVPYNLTLNSAADLKKYVLLETEFDVLESIKSLLKPFKTATKDISNQAFPTIPLCAVWYVELFQHLEKFFPNTSNKENPINKDTKEIYPEWMQSAAKASHTKLSEYYPTSDGAVYIIGSVMDPRCKLQWFSQQFKPSIISGYRKMVVNCWTQNYKPSNIELPETISPKRPTNAWVRLTQANQSTSRKDELEVYLSEKLSLNADKSALEWWKLHEDEFPNLSKMARDFLPISGSGVPVECLFSNGPDLLRNRRQSLKDETIRKCICLKLWLSTDSTSRFGKAAAEKMTGQ